jgi:hypothetical protein
MDMDPKGNEEEATSHKNDQGGSVENNGVQGMQLNGQQFGEFKVGSIDVQLSPTGTPCSAENFVKKKPTL